MMRTSVTAAIAAVVAAFAPATAAAQVPTQDSVVGSGVATTTTDFPFEIDAHSGPSGENPTGHVTFRSAATGDVFFTGPVTCVDVSGSFAILTVDTDQYGFVGLEVTDSPSGDLIRGIPTGLSTCGPIGPAVDFRVISGDVAVIDAQPLPTSKEQCKHGGWRSYGFKNQGACVSFVAKHPK